MVDDARERLSGELDFQAGCASGGLRQWADELGRMAESGADGSPVRTVVRQLSDGGPAGADGPSRAPLPAATGTSAPVPGTTGVPAQSGGSYGTTPYEDGAQATPPTGPSGQVR